MYSLDSARLKVKRAKQHLNSLTRSLKRAGHDRRHTVWKVKHPEANRTLYRVEIGGEVREAWSLLAGDIVSNLRNALDHIAWQLSIMHTPSLSDGQGRQVYFPLQVKPNERGFRSRTKFMSRASAELVECFQPYNATDWPDLQLLEILDGLSRIDKHRLVIETYNRMVLGGPNSGQAMRLYEGAEILLTEKTYQRFKSEIGVDVGISPGSEEFPLGGESIFVLYYIHEFIADDVIPTFSRLFE